MAKRLTSEDGARIALGNLKNHIALHFKVRPTQHFVVETFGKTAINAMRMDPSSGADAHLGDFSSSYSAHRSDSFEEQPVMTVRLWKMAETHPRYGLA